MRSFATQSPKPFVDNDAKEHDRRIAGVVADYANFADALAANDVISVNDVLSISSLTLGADKQLINAGGSVDCDSSSTGVVEFITLGDRASANDVTFNMTMGAAGTGQMFLPGDYNRFVGCTFDGGVSGGASPSHISHILDFDPGNVTGFQSIGNVYKNFTRVVLKANSSTSSQRGIAFIGDLWIDAYNEACALNNPNGTLKGAAFIGVTRLQETAGIASAHMIGSASGQDIRVIGAASIGESEELFHIEEAARRFTLIGSTGLLEGARAGFFVTDNNVGGSSEVPEVGAILGNAFERDARGTGNAAFDFANDASGAPAARYVAQVGNAAKTWHRGLRSAEEPGLNLHALNVYADMDEGLQMAKPSLHIFDHLLINCGTLVDVQSNGMTGTVRVTVEDASAWTGAVALITEILSTSADHASITELIVEIENVSFAAATAVNWKLFPLPWRIRGDSGMRVDGFVAPATGTYRFFGGKLEYDGTTLTWAADYEDGTGVFDFVDFRDDGTDIQLRVNNTGAAVTGRMQLRFHNGQFIV